MKLLGIQIKGSHPDSQEIDEKSLDIFNMFELYFPPLLIFWVEISVKIVLNISGYHLTIFIETLNRLESSPSGHIWKFVIKYV